MRLRRKLTVAFFGVSSVLSVLLALALYRFLERQMEDDLRDRLRDVTHIGSHVIDRAAYRRLLAQFGELDEVRVTAVEDSPDYALIAGQLDVIRKAEPTLIQFAYLLAPTADPNAPRFVVDADVLALRAKAASGEKLGEHESISHFNQAYDVSEIPLLAKALAECTPQLEPDFVYDAEFGVNSVSAYIPLTDRAGTPERDANGRCLGVLGVDITDRKMRAALEEAGGLALKLSFAAVVIALLVSIAMGTVLTRSVLALSDTVQRFAAKDFSARTPPLPRDEIGQLGDNFNAMAATIQVHSEQLEFLLRVLLDHVVARRDLDRRNRRDRRARRRIALFVHEPRAFHEQVRRRHVDAIDALDEAADELELARRPGQQVVDALGVDGLLGGVEARVHDLAVAHEDLRGRALGRAQLQKPGLALELDQHEQRRQPDLREVTA